MNKQKKSAGPQRRWGLIIALSGVVMLEGVYGCAGQDGVEEFIEDNIGEVAEALVESETACTVPPAPPSSVTTTKTSAIRVTWSDTNEKGYYVERRTATRPWTRIWSLPINNTSIVDRNVIPGIQYEYRIVAYNDCGSSYSPSAFDQTQPRRWLNSLSVYELNAIAYYMDQYLTDPVVQAHANINHMGAPFFQQHREYIQNFEDYLVARGRPDLVPLPMWDSGVIIPAEMRRVRSRDDGTPRPALVNVDPRLPKPTSYRAPSVCAWTSLESLGSEVSMGGWHGPVHVRVGGNMNANFANVAASHIFWPWHSYVDDVWVDWQRNCQPN